MDIMKIRLHHSPSETKNHFYIGYHVNQNVSLTIRYKNPFKIDIDIIRMHHSQFNTKNHIYNGYHVN